MEIEARLADLASVVKQHREVLLTEEAAKNALVMPFLQTLGYNVFNPSEVVPEYTADVGTKRGEKVDYAVCDGDKVRLLVECKPANSELTLANASQLYRYFSVTAARLAILTNGVIYKFFTDADAPNKMDDKPFFTLNLEHVRGSDVKILSKFAKGTFDIESILNEACDLKLQTLVARELAELFSEPSEEFIRIVAAKVHEGRLTPAVREKFKLIITNAIAATIRDRVNDRLTSALSASDPAGAAEVSDDASDQRDIVTTQEEIDGFNIVRAIGSKAVDPKRIVMRDAKSYCAILLDDNNRKTIARMHFNSPTSRYFGSFAGKEETRHPVIEPTDIYQMDALILGRIAELEAGAG